MKIENRVAIFQYEFQLQFHTSNLALRLAESGYHVDVFIFNCFDKFEIVNEMQVNNINCYDLSDLKKKKQRKKGLIGRIQNKVNIISCRFNKEIIASKVFERSMEIIQDNKYLFFIGVEKKGLIWAGQLAEQICAPYFYYSLELYIEDHPYRFTNTVEFTKVREAEKRYHNCAMATIIQDKLRAKVLHKYNNIISKDIIEIPVSVPGKRNDITNNYFHQLFNLKLNQKIILSFGAISSSRFIHELVDTSSKFNEDSVLILHGTGDEKDLTFLQKKTTKNFILSKDIVSNDKLDLLISSAYIGLALYSNDNHNDRLTAFSSAKMALYLKSGIPIIAFENESYSELMNHYCCGRLIRDITEIPYAISEISKDYAKYRRNAFLAFEELYNFDIRFAKFKIYIENQLLKKIN